jgi:cell division protein FtsL
LKCIATKTTVRKMDTFSSINEMYHTLSPQELSHGIVAVGSLSLLVLGYLYYGINAEVKKLNLELEDQKAELDDALNNVDDLLLKSANSAERVELEHLSSKVDGILEEMDRESIEEGKYQAWKGQVPNELDVLIVREKLGTHKSNQSWLNWDGKDNGSVKVRDFYINSCSIDWTLVKDNANLIASLDDVMINGWNSVVRMKIAIKKPLTAIVRGNITYAKFDNHGDEMAQKQHMTMAVLQQELSNKIQWQRVLVDSNVSSPIIDVLF